MLAAADPETGKYVLTHEIAHLFHMDHSAAFRAQVEAWLPEWKNLRTALRMTEKRLAGQKWE